MVSNIGKLWSNRPIHTIRGVRHTVKGVRNAIWLYNNEEFLMEQITNKHNNLVSSGNEKNQNIKIIKIYEVFVHNQLRFISLMIRMVKKVRVFVTRI